MHIYVVTGEAETLQFHQVSVVNVQAALRFFFFFSDHAEALNVLSL